MEHVFQKLRASGVEPFDGPATSEARAGDLVRRVRVRAAEVFELIEASVGEDGVNDGGYRCKRHRKRQVHIFSGLRAYQNALRGRRRL